MQCTRKSLGIDLLAQIPVAAVRTFRCHDVRESLTWLDAKTPDFMAFKVVQTWEQLPHSSAVVTDTLVALAQASYDRFPAWYGQKILSVDKNILSEECRALKAGQPSICEPWLKAAVRACQLGRLPLLKQFPHALHLSQLALAIAPQPLVLFLAMLDPQPAEFRLFGFAKTVSWIAKETGARVATLIPSHLGNSAELAAILYGAVDLAFSTDSASSNSAPDQSQTSWMTNGAAHQVGSTPEVKSIDFISTLSPPGKPHPSSPGEQQLADRLCQDQELAGLFWCNQPIKTVRDNAYLVDLVWLAGQVIVEIDGYHYHGDRDAFRADRHRDYELLISGYLVLRLPHDEVISDLEIAIEKIRDVVRFRRTQFFNQGGI